MDKQEGRQSLLALVKQLVLEKEENSEFKPAVLHLKIDLVLYPAYGVGIESMFTLPRTNFPTGYSLVSYASAFFVWK